MVIFLNVCLWRHSLRSNLEGIDPEKLYLAIFICQYALCCCIVWPSFLFVDDCFVKIWATCDNFLGKWSTAPSVKKLPVRLCVQFYHPSFLILKRRYSVLKKHVIFFFNSEAWFVYLIMGANGVFQGVFWVTMLPILKRTST